MKNINANKKFKVLFNKNKILICFKGLLEKFQ